MGREGSPGHSVFSGLSLCNECDKYQLIEFYGPIVLDMFTYMWLFQLKILKINNLNTSSSVGLM